MVKSFQTKHNNWITGDFPLTFIVMKCLPLHLVMASVKPLGMKDLDQGVRVTRWTRILYTGWPHLPLPIISDAPGGPHNAVLHRRACPVYFLSSHELSWRYILRRLKRVGKTLYFPSQYLSLRRISNSYLSIPFSKKIINSYHSIQGSF